MPKKIADQFLNAFDKLGENNEEGLDVKKLNGREGYLSLANCYSSRYGELIKPSVMSLPTGIIQCNWQFRSVPSNFSWRVTAE
jgi:hypothetical protein